MLLEQVVVSCISEKNFILIHNLRRHFANFSRHKDPKQILVIENDHIVSLRRLSISPKQEVDFTSVFQTGNISLFYWIGSREN